MNCYKEFNSPEGAQYVSEAVKPLAASGGYPKNIGFSARNISNWINQCHMRNCWVLIHLIYKKLIINILFLFLSQKGSKKAIEL